MSRYIDTDGLKFVVEKNFGHGTINPILQLIDAQQPADVVEVVRCKDCIFNHEHETPLGSRFHICDINGLAFNQYADFFCAYGERKGETNG